MWGPPRTLLESHLRHWKLTVGRYRWGEDLIGSISSVPLGFDYWSHRIQHMQHHAFTNDPKRDPDYHLRCTRPMPVNSIPGGTHF